VVRLSAEIQKHQGKRQYGGQQPARPADKHAALVDLQRMTSRWIRWIERLQGEQGGGAELSDLPFQVRKGLQDATKNIRRLREAVDGALAVISD
jgi:hypothetical protein